MGPRVPLPTCLYACANCGTAWEDAWSCGCDDECPNCGEHSSPIDSKKVGFVLVTTSGTETIHKPHHRHRPCPFSSIVRSTNHAKKWSVNANENDYIFLPPPPPPATHPPAHPYPTLPSPAPPSNKTPKSVRGDNESWSLFNVLSKCPLTNNVAGRSKITVITVPVIHRTKEDAPT